MHHPYMLMYDVVACLQVPLKVGTGRQNRPTRTVVLIELAFEPHFLQVDLDMQG
jgi:hypothetical protein